MRRKPETLRVWFGSPTRQAARLEDAKNEIASLQRKSFSVREGTKMPSKSYVEARTKLRLISRADFPYSLA